MTKSEEIIQNMTDGELRILVLCFSSSKVIKAMKIYHTIPGFLKSVFVDAGKKELEKRGIIDNQITVKKNLLLE